jgi:hypothetical protein
LGTIENPWIMTLTTHWDHTTSRDPEIQRSRGVYVCTSFIIG